MSASEMHIRLNRSILQNFNVLMKMNNTPLFKEISVNGD